MHIVGLGLMTIACPHYIPLAVIYTDTFVYTTEGRRYYCCGQALA